MTATRPAPVDLSRIRVGDFVTVRMRVVELQLTDANHPIAVYGDAFGLEHRMWPYIADIADIAGQGRALAVGDRVDVEALKDGGCPGTLLGLDDGQGWVRWDHDGSHGTWAIDTLVRV